LQRADAEGYARPAPVRCRLALAVALLSGAAVSSPIGEACAQRSSRGATSSEPPPASVRLDWSADEESCPPLDLVREQVAEVLGRDPFSSAAGAEPGYVVRVEISAETAQWSALLELRDGRDAVLGSRTVRARARDCATLADSLSLVLAMVIDLSRQHAELTLPDFAPQQPASRPAGAGDVPPAAPGHRLELALRTGPGVAIELLAPATLGYHLSLLVSPDPVVGVRVSLDLFPSEIASDGIAAVELRAATASVDACFELVHARPVGLSLCAGGVLGAALGTGRDLDVIRTEAGPIAGVQGGAIGRIAVGAETFVELDGGIIGWIVRQDFGYLDSGTPRLLREIPVVSGLVRLSLGWHFHP
jgi:hypothetical protein